MPKLPHLSGAEVQRGLESLGYVVMRREAKGCVVPMHKEVKLGTLAGILRQAEVSPQEFLAALQR